MQNLWLISDGLIAMTGLGIYVISSHTLHQRRHPSAAIAWVVSLLLLPYVALPLYLMFGFRKVGKFHTPAKRSELTLPRSDTNTLCHRTQELAAIMSLPKACGYHTLNIHEGGEQALQALRDMIARATQSIDLCTFIFARDELGDEIALSLMQRAGEGIRVRLLVDGVGAYLGGHTDLTCLSGAGVQVALFVPPLRSSMRGRTNLRNHRKMVIVDKTGLWSGGRNLATEYFAGTNPWTDLSFDLQGSLALQAQQQFELDWAFAGTSAIPATMHSPCPVSESAIGQMIASGPDQRDDTFYTLLVSSFFGARKRILAVTPYFVPDPTLLMSLTLAARRGVAVDILLPKKSNHRLTDFARHRALRELVSAGARVWLYPQMIHAKTVVIDDEIAFAGSANLDQRSLFLNYEMMICFYQATDVQRFSQWIEHHIGKALPYHAKKPGIGLEVAEGLLLWLAFQL
jgi:cardiolipin synthase